MLCLKYPEPEEVSQGHPAGSVFASKVSLTNSCESSAKTFIPNDSKHPTLKIPAIILVSFFIVGLLVQKPLSPKSIKLSGDNIHFNYFSITLFNGFIFEFHVNTFTFSPSVKS